MQLGCRHVATTSSCPGSWRIFNNPAVCALFFFTNTHRSIPTAELFPTAVVLHDPQCNQYINRRLENSATGLPIGTLTTNRNRHHAWPLILVSPALCGLRMARFVERWHQIIMQLLTSSRYSYCHVSSVDSRRQTTLQ